jgi:hypothetical protein
VSGGKETIFPIVEAVILHRHGIAHEHQPGISEIQAPFFQGDGSLRRVKADAHGFNVSH